MISIGLFGIPILLLLTYGVGRWIFSPLCRAALEPRPRTQFLLSDLYVLLLQLSLIGLGLFALSKDDRKADTVVSMVMLWLFVTWIWYLSVKWLSGANVRSAKHRAAVSLAAPFSFSMFAVLPYVFLIFGIRSSTARSTSGDVIITSANNNSVNSVQLQAAKSNEALVTAIYFGLPVLFVLAGTMGTRWLIRRALRSRETPASESAEELGSPEIPLSA